MTRFRRIMAVVFAAAAAGFCLVISETLAFSQTRVTAGGDGFAAAAEASAQGLLPLLLLLPAAATAVFSVLNIWDAFRNTPGTKVRWWLLILLLLIVLFCGLLPPQSYAVGLYAVFRSFFGQNGPDWFRWFSWLGPVIAVLTGFSLLSVGKKERQK